MSTESVTQRRMDLRTVELFREQLERVHLRTDRVFLLLMPLQYLAGVAIALWVSPHTWLGARSEVHVHLVAALVLGATISVPPLWLALRSPGHEVTRHVIAAAQMLWSALLIHLSGGRIETHFHVFGSLAFLSFYRDSRVLITASVVVALDHFLRGVWWPQSVFGVLGASPYRWLEHAAWVVFEDVFLLYSVHRARGEMRELAGRQAALETTNERVESEVQQRTEELREARMMAERASQAKSVFLANMSHEIRTPITAMLGYAEIIGEAPCAKEHREHVDTMLRSGRHLLDVINDILDVSKIESGKMVVESESCSLPAILGEVASLMRVRAKARGIEFVIECVGDVPEMIESDQTRLKQILVNLIGNSIKFTDEGAVTVRVALVEVPEVGRRLKIDVVDTGIGMSPEQVERVFSPFEQADGSTTRRFGGSGLGLAISRELARMLGGELRASSVLGEGSTLTVTIDPGALRGVAWIRDLEEDMAAARVPASPQVSGARLQGRVLLAEDGRDNRRVITLILKKFGLEVDVAEDGRSACDRIHEASAAGTPFDLVLMDMQMPVLDGYGATRELRKTGCDVPVIALTAHAMEGDRDKCLGAGCDDFASKPIDRSALFDTIAKWLGR